MKKIIVPVDEFHIGYFISEFFTNLNGSLFKPGLILGKKKFESISPDDFLYGTIDLKNTMPEYKAVFKENLTNFLIKYEQLKKIKLFFSKVKKKLIEISKVYEKNSLLDIELINGLVKLVIDENIFDFPYFFVDELERDSYYIDITFKRLLFLKKISKDINFEKELFVAAVLADLPLFLLQKKDMLSDFSLTNEQKNIIKEHSSYIYNEIEETFSESVANLVKYHHISDLNPIFSLTVSNEIFLLFDIFENYLKNIKDQYESFYKFYLNSIRKKSITLSVDIEKVLQSNGNIALDLAFIRTSKNKLAIIYHIKNEFLLDTLVIFDEKRIFLGDYFCFSKATTHEIMEVLDLKDWKLSYEKFFSD